MAGAHAPARWRLLAMVLAWLLLGPLAGPAAAQEAGADVELRDGKVQLDFTDVELSVVIDTIARLTGRNFIYDDRVRGRVTIVSPTPISVEEAYRVFESVLQVKGFTTVEAPGGALKVIPIREAKESSVQTSEGRGRPPETDRFITRLIPLRYIDAEDITNTLKPLVSKDASMVAYAPTNTVILTDSASNIARVLSILRSIDVKTYKEELTVLKIRHADAARMAEQISEIFDVESGADGALSAAARVRRRVRAAQQQANGAEPASRGRVRILVDERTNSLIVMASRQRTDEIRGLVRRLDVPVTGGGRIHVLYLKHADSEELAETLQSMLSGQPAGGAAGGAAGGSAAAQALRAAVTELSEGVTVTADPATNSLVIQASQEGFRTLRQVIDQLDRPRPQVLVEALIMEVDVSDSESLGFRALVELFQGDKGIAIQSLTSSGGFADGEGDDRGNRPNNITGQAASLLTGNFAASAIIDSDDSVIQAVIDATASQGGTNILSAPHILTLDNEEAEIQVGNNIPIITSRVQSAAGVSDAGDNLATSQNIEREDIGVTLRVTPQISEGDQLRLEIFQEITDINQGLTQTVAGTGGAQDVGVALTNRTVENTVVVADGDTVVIGGLISDNFDDNVDKVPWLGDIPVLGWFFKSTSRNLRKTNLLIFLTPHILRTAVDLEYQTIRKREEFWDRSQEGVDLSEEEKEEQEERRKAAREAGIDFQPVAGRRPVRARLLEHADRYPVERMRAIEAQREEEAQAAREAARRAEDAPRYGVVAARFADDEAAAELLQELLDAGYDGTLVSGELDGQLLYEVRVGPFENLEAAEDGADVLREGFGLDPRVTVERQEP